MLDRKQAERFDQIWVNEGEEWDKERVKERTLAKLHGETVVASATVNGEISPKFAPKKSHRKKTMLVLLAAIIAIMGTFTYGAERDWDVRFAEQLGLSDVMIDLPGGYKKIDVSQTSGDITLTVAQSIGDKSSQWIEIDTNLPWEGAEEAWDIFEHLDVHAYDGDSMIAGGNTVEPFEANDKLSFRVYMEGYDGINKANMLIKANTFNGETFELKWKNYYASNARVNHPLTKVMLSVENGTDLMAYITKVEVTPVSLRVEAWTNPLGGDVDVENVEHLSIESITLKNGTVMEVDRFDVGGVNGSGFLDVFLSLADIASGNDIASITISGVEIQL